MSSPRPVFWLPLPRAAELFEVSRAELERRVRDERSLEYRVRTLPGGPRYLVSSAVLTAEYHIRERAEPGSEVQPDSGEHDLDRRIDELEALLRRATSARSRLAGHVVNALVVALVGALFLIFTKREPIPWFVHQYEVVAEGLAGVWRSQVVVQSDAEPVPFDGLAPLIAGPGFESARFHSLDSEDRRIQAALDLLDRLEPDLVLGLRTWIDARRLALLEIDREGDSAERAGPSATALTFKRDGVPVAIAIDLERTVSEVAISLLHEAHHLFDALSGGSEEPSPREHFEVNYRDLVAIRDMALAGLADLAVLERQWRAKLEVMRRQAAMGDFDLHREIIRLDSGSRVPVSQRGFPRGAQGIAPSGHGSLGHPDDAGSRPGSGTRRAEPAKSHVQAEGAPTQARIAGAPAAAS